MSFDEAVRPHEHSRYEGEDTSPTTARELNGWYSTPIAAEVYGVVAIGAFLPVLLEQLARENGVFFSDRTKPCIETGGAGATNQVRPRGDAGHNEQCVINLLGMELTSASFAMYTSSLAVLVQALTLVCFSSFADHGPYRKKMLMTFAYTGSIASASFIFITPKVYFLAPLLAIIGITCLGCSFVLLNAFLPLLVAHHPDGSKNLTSDSSSDFELEALNPESNSTAIRRSDPEKLAKDLERSSKISSKGVGLGYIASVFVQCLSIVILIVFDKLGWSKNNPSLPIRVSMLMCGVWWATFTIPTYLWLRPRPGPPLPTQTGISLGSRKMGSTLIFYTMFSLRSFWATLTRAIRLRQTLLFLCAWFLISDAVATIAGTAILFARTELEMGTIAIALLSITSIGSGIVGAFAWPRVAAHYTLQSKTVLLMCLFGLEFIPIYGLLGYVPLFQKLGFIGLQKAWEIYPVAVVHGISMGGISSYSRSVFAPLIPEGKEAAFFALFAVTDKGSSAVGPALVGWIVDRAGTIRPSFGFLAVLVIIPMPLIWRLNVEKGREDAARMAEGSNRRAREFDE